MDLEIMEFPYGIRPKVEMPDKMLLHELGEDGVKEMISQHYELLFKSEIASLFPTDKKLQQIAKNSAADFFIQIFGGPSYYKQNRGAPMMTKRHQQFTITPQARKVWLQCYKEVLEGLEISTHLKESFWHYLNIFSIWMVNTPQT